MEIAINAAAASWQHPPKCGRCTWGTGAHHEVGSLKPKAPHPVRWKTAKGTPGHSLGQLRDSGNTGGRAEGGNAPTRTKETMKGVRKHKRSGWKIQHNIQNWRG
jgi:hypothetical protein